MLDYYIFTIVIIIYRVHEIIGSGEFGTVYRGEWCHSEKEEEVAVKSMDSKVTEDNRVKFLQEAAIMGQFKHCNILSIRGIISDKPVSQL